MAKQNPTAHSRIALVLATATVTLAGALTVGALTGYLGPRPAPAPLEAAAAPLDPGAAPTALPPALAEAPPVAVVPPTVAAVPAWRAEQVARRRHGRWRGNPTALATEHDQGDARDDGRFSPTREDEHDDE